MNPFDGYPKIKLPARFPMKTKNPCTILGAQVLEWRWKWEPIILEAMRKAEMLDLFYELGESARTMVEESVREYLEEREGD